LLQAKEKKFEEELRQWQAPVGPNDRGAARARKPKYSYKTVDELKAEGGAASTLQGV
jgi:hypothetical protein